MHRIAIHQQGELLGFRLETEMTCDGVGLRRSGEKGVAPERERPSSEDARWPQTRNGGVVMALLLPTFISCFEMCSRFPIFKIGRVRSSSEASFPFGAFSDHFSLLLKLERVLIGAKENRSLRHHRHPHIASPTFPCLNISTKETRRDPNIADRRPLFSSHVGLFRCVRCFVPRCF